MFLSQPFIESLRPKHWTKNILVFSAPLFNFDATKQTWFLALLSLIIFCLISSSIYQINDLIDINSDRKHPVKKFRPIASGKIKRKYVFLSSIILFVLSLFLAFILNFQLFFIVTIYGVIQILYCLKFKNEPIIDIFCISSGFLLRSSAGGLAAKLYISPWFYLTVGLLSLFLAIEKRKAELRTINETGEITRVVLRKYSLPLLLRFENIVASGSFITYALWSAGPALGGAPTSLMLITVPIVLIGIFRYQLLSDPSINAKNDLNVENPVNILIYDKWMRTIILLWVFITFLIGLFTEL